MSIYSASHGRALGGTEIHSALSGWGGWTTKLYCPAEYFLVGGRGRSEAHEDDQDDTAGMLGTEIIMYYNIIKNQYLTTLSWYLLCVLGM